jgi:hypothetical protein
MKTIGPVFHLVLTILVLGVLSELQAVIPPPDGGYPGFNTAEGKNALLHLTTGAGNTAVGWYSLFSDTSGNYNTGLGAGALALNNADSNTATGAGALLSNTTGPANTANGAFALLSNTTGAGNTGSGYQALFANQEGANNAAYGYTALYNNTGSFNTAFGSQTLVYNTAGTQNTAAGYQALVFNTVGDSNTATGYQALFSNTTGAFDTATGSIALFGNITGEGNTAIGHGALFSNTSGSNNTALGNGAGTLTTGDDNIEIGNIGVPGESGTIRIGNNLTTTATYLAGIAGQTVGAGGTTCYVDNDGKLGVFLSARRFKTDIADMGGASEALLALRPVTFHYKPELDKTGIPQFGLVADEVAEVNSDLVTYDAKGEICTVRYEAVNAMLLNEFLKEHRKVDEQDRKVHEQQTTIARLTKQIETIIAHSKEQDAQIQRVRDQVQINSPAERLISSNH